MKYKYCVKDVNGNTAKADISIKKKFDVMIIRKKCSLACFPCSWVRGTDDYFSLNGTSILKSLNIFK